MIAQEQQARLIADERPGAPDGVAVALGLGLDGETQPLLEVDEPAGLLLGRIGRLGRLEERGVVAELLAVDRLIARAQTTQISSMPLSMASSAMIWSTGLVKPSRSTSGSMAFCTVSAAGYCLAPRPAAVITALVTSTAAVPLRLHVSVIRSRPRGRLLARPSFPSPRQGIRLTTPDPPWQPRPLTPRPQIA